MEELRNLTRMSLFIVLAHTAIYHNPAQELYGCFFKARPSATPPKQNQTDTPKEHHPYYNILYYDILYTIIYYNTPAWIKPLDRTAGCRVAGFSASGAVTPRFFREINRYLIQMAIIKHEVLTVTIVDLRGFRRPGRRQPLWKQWPQYSRVKGVS